MCPAGKKRRSRLYTRCQIAIGPSPRRPADAGDSHFTCAVIVRLAKVKSATMAASGGGWRVEIDWPALRALAAQTAASAHAPYSKLQVGAAGQVGDGRVIVGCNVENASYGLTLC